MHILSLLKKRYRTLNTIEISAERLKQNYQYLFKNSDLLIAPVLKSNAYGHGIVQVAKIFDDIDAPFFCVDSLHEAYQLLKAHIRTPILIMGYTTPENLQVKKLPFSYAVYTEEMLEAVKLYQPHAGVHLFVDTGMHREGVALEDLESFVSKALSLGLKIEGLMSHFAMADKPNAQQTKQQVACFVQAQEILRSMNVFPKFVHIAASSGVLHAKKMPKQVEHDGSILGNVGRVGIALYGIDPEGKNTQLKPALSLTTTIAQIKQIKKGEKIGYDFTFTAKKNMKVAILPIGYNDGVNRKLSNNGVVQYKNTYCPIVGRVSMNITIVDVSFTRNAQVGDEVIIYSANPKDKNSVVNVAKSCGVIPYEILVQLHASTKRVVI